jgi:hypothetical protein
MDRSQQLEVFRRLLKVPRRERRRRARECLKRGRDVEAALWATPIVLSPHEAHLLRHGQALCGRCKFYVDPGVHVARPSYPSRYMEVYKK